tara:strand:- start:1118 stop:2476 length:1359 start_codon:yes stop_codon:yes gene_type:complete
MSLIEDIFSGVEKQLLGAFGSLLREGLNVKGIGNDFHPGDVELIDIILLSEDQQRTYSLISQCSSIEIYESIMSPVMWAEITIADSSGLLQHFPIIGEEYVKVVFKTPGKGSIPVQYLMRVNAVTNKTPNQTNKRISYTLQCVSAELITNATASVNLKVEGTADFIIGKIFEEFIKTQKPVNIFQSDGILDFLITKYAPFEAIDMIRQRAVSNRYTSSSYCFYENRKGFNFITIEQLIELGQKAIEAGNSDKLFFYDTSRKDSINDVTVRNIIAYNRIQFADSIGKIKAGGMNNEVQQFDLITGDISKTTYTDNIGADAFGSTSSTSGSGQSTSFTRNHGKAPAVSRIIPSRSDKPETDLQVKLTKVSAYAQKLVQNITQIHIYGDSTIQAGDMIECRLPSGVDTTTDDGMSRLDSGSYLVSKVRHIILNGDRPQYTQALELIKNDIQEVVS